MYDSARETDNPKLTIIIPTLNSEGSIGRLLDSLTSQTSQEFEVIVVDGGSADSTVSIASDRGCRCLRVMGNRSRARNIGADSARGQFLMFLDSDFEASPHLVAESILALHLSDAVLIPESTDYRGNLWAEARALERDSVGGNWDFEVPRCFRFQAFREAGGYDETMTGLEDVDLRERALRLHLSIGRVSHYLIHDERAIGPLRYLRKRMAYGAADPSFRARYPERWRRMNAIQPRIGFALKAARMKKLPKGAMLFVAWFAQRGAEFMLRATIAKLSTTSGR